MPSTGCCPCCLRYPQQARIQGFVLVLCSLAFKVCTSGPHALTISPQTFRNLTVFANASMGSITVSGGSSLRRCAAGLSGGAVHVGGPLHSLELSGGSSLDSNTAAGGDGGCVAASTLLRLVVADSEMVNNRAAAAAAGPNAAAAAGGNGGGGARGSGGCVFSGSATNGAAGNGIGGGGSSGGMGAMVWSVSRSQLINNTAAADGGKPKLLACLSL